MPAALTTVMRAVLGTALFLCAIMTMAGAAMADAKADQALIAAAGRGDTASVRRLLGEGASVTARDGQGRTALLAATHAAPGAGTEAARLLIAAGADVNAKDHLEDSAYLYAAAEGRNDILKLMLAHGADLTSTNRYGGTGLIPAAHHGHLETVRILLGTAIDKNHVNKLGWTALLEAIVLGDGGKVHTDIVRELARAGADVTIADHDGVTPLTHARRRGYAAIAAILEGAGAR